MKKQGEKALEMTDVELALSRLPATIRIGPFDYTLKTMSAVESSARHRYGECSPQQEEITLAISHPSLVKLVDTLLHEITHAIFDAANIEEGDKDERIVTKSGTGWTQVYRDNLWLLDWIKDCLA